ncbi:MAG TPA: nitroreductase family protein [candidate division Zixibacteria bacterium]
MELFDTIHSRRTIRTFTGKKVPKEDLEKIVDAGRVAPSAVNRQMWDFVVVTEKDVLDDIVHHFKAGRKYGTYEDGKFDGCSAIIAVILDEKNEYWIEDGSSATVSMLLAARGLGWGSCWIEGGVRPHEDHFKELLSVPKGKRMLLMIALGEPVKCSPPPSKKTLTEIIHWEKF